MARLDDVEPGPGAVPTVRWDTVGCDTVGCDTVGWGVATPAADGPTDAGAPVAEWADLGAEIEDRAAVADLGSATTAPGAVVASDLAMAREPARAAAARTARLGETSRGDGRRLAAGSRVEPAVSRRGVRAGTRPWNAPGTTGPDHTIGPDPSSDDDGSGGVDERPASPRRRGGPKQFGPKQIDPDADPAAAAREICLRLLTDRARTRHELAQALGRRGVPDDAAASVLERFDEVGLIDDAAFAGQWVRSRHNHRGLARRAIAMELRRKGVDDEVASEALEDLDPDAESRRARELVDRKLRSLTVDTPEQRTSAARRLVGMLARKGYGAGIAYGVVREALAAHGADAADLGTESADD